MIFSIQLALFTLVYVGGLAALRIPQKRQSGRSTLSAPATLATAASENEGDHVPAETGFAGPLAAATGHHGSKYFQ